MSSETSDKQARLSDAEHAALSTRGLSLYEEKLKSLLEPNHDSEYVAIHADSEEYALGDSSGSAMRAMRQRKPHGSFAILQIGSEPEWGLAARLLAGQMVAGQQK